MAKQPKTKKAASTEVATTRYQIRCPVDRLAAWDAHAKALGFASAGAWMQRLADKAIEEHPAG